MNVEMFPKSANVYDSLSEGYLYLGDRGRAEKVLTTALQTENAEKSFVEQLSRTLRDIEINAWLIRSETREVFRFRPGESTGLRGPFLGQDPPGDEPKVFAPGIVSVLGHNDFSASFSPDGKEFYFNRGMTIMVCRWKTEGWTAPEPAAFNRGFRSHLAHLVFDNQRMFFGSRRPPQPYGIWLTERTSVGWSEPRALPEIINFLSGIHWGVSVDREGNLYFSAGERIRYSQYRNGRYGEPVILDSLKDDNAYSPLISPDESYLLGNIEDEGERMFISFKKKDGAWTEPVDLADIVGVKHGFCPMVTPNGRYLFFLSMLDGIYAPYWMDASFIEKLKMKALIDN